MFKFLLAGIIFNDMNTSNYVSKEDKDMGDKTYDEIIPFTCPHCTETYDEDYLEQMMGLCPICGLDVEEEYNAIDINEIGDRLDNLIDEIEQIKESFVTFSQQITQINKRLKNLENK